MQVVQDPLMDALQGLETFRVLGPDDKTIRAAFVPYPGDEPRGSVILAPGRTEYIEKYAETISDLLARGFNVLAVDHRGQGWSDRLGATAHAGHLDSFSKATEHMALAVAAVADRLTGKRILLSHSMGGTICLEALLTHAIPNVVGAAFSAPMWGILAPPGMGLLAKSLVATGKAKDVAPSLPTTWQPEAFEANQVTHDQKRFARNNALMLEEPALQIAGPTNGWLDEAMKTMASFTPARLSQISIPILVVSAEGETIVDNAAHVRICGQMPHGQLRLVAGSKHELLHEVDAIRAAFWAHFDTWADQVLA
jgi:lysophospholipase